MAVTAITVTAMTVTAMTVTVITTTIDRGMVKRPLFGGPPFHFPPNRRASKVRDFEVATDRDRLVVRHAPRLIDQSLSSN